MVQARLFKNLSIGLVLCILIGLVVAIALKLIVYLFDYWVELGQYLDSIDRSLLVGYIIASVLFFFLTLGSISDALD